MLVVAHNVWPLIGSHIVLDISTLSHPGSDPDVAAILDESNCVLLILMLQFFSAVMIVCGMNL